MKSKVTYYQYGYGGVRAHIRNIIRCVRLNILIRRRVR